MSFDANKLRYQIALTLLPNVGCITAKTLLSYCGSLEAVFRTKKSRLLKIPGIGNHIAEQVVAHGKDALERAEAEVEFVEKNEVNPLFFLDKDFPQRLNNCADSPVMLYYKGNVDLNVARVLAVVGTRNISDYGRDICERFVGDLAKYGVLVVSGMAFGVDYCAHRNCVRNQVPTVGVFAHGLDRVYPRQHDKLAAEMLTNGGLLTEFMSGSKPDRENFPKRNRIIAGIADATILVETANKGGSIITAHLAASYNRDVYAFPGRVNDKYSKGCNRLIRDNVAGLITSAEDLVRHLGWEQETMPETVQRQLFVQLSDAEQNIVDVLRRDDGLHIDGITQSTGMTGSAVAAHLLSLEFKGVVKSVPGSRYRLVM